MSGKKYIRLIYVVFSFFPLCSKGIFWPILYLKDHVITEKRISMHDGGHLKFLKMEFNLNHAEDSGLKKKLFSNIQRQKDTFELHPIHDKATHQHNNFCWYEVYQKGSATGHFFYVCYVPRPGSVQIEDFGSTVYGSARVSMEFFLHYIFFDFWTNEPTGAEKIQLMGCPEFLFCFQKSNKESHKILQQMYTLLLDLYQLETLDNVQLANTMVQNVLKLTRDENDSSLFYLSLSRLSLGFHLQSKIREQGTTSFRSIPRSELKLTENSPLLGSQKTEQLNVESPPKRRQSTRRFPSLLNRGECLLL